MGAPQKNPLRTFAEIERQQLERLTRASYDGTRKMEYNIKQKIKG